jgi:hypothetical protein
VWDWQGDSQKFLQYSTHWWIILRVIDLGNKCCSRRNLLITSNYKRLPYCVKHCQMTESILHTVADGKDTYYISTIMNLCCAAYWPTCASGRQQWNVVSMPRSTSRLDTSGKLEVDGQTTNTMVVALKAGQLRVVWQRCRQRGARNDVAVKW